MSTHTDGAPPSVRSAGTGDDPPAANAGVPPRPRRPSPGGPEEDGADAARAPQEGTPSPDGTAARGNGDPSRRPAEPGAGSAVSNLAWLQQEIARRVAERGLSDSGRHALPDTAAGDPDDDGEDGEDDTRAPRPVPARPRSFRARSGWTPDPYAPGGLRRPRTGDGWPASDDGTGPEPAFRLPGPAARPRPSTPSPGTADPASGTADAGAGSAADTPPDPTAAAGTAAAAGTGPAADAAAAGSPAVPAPSSAPAEPKQWPPARGGSGLPRRVPGAGWTLDRAMLLGDSTGPDTETRPVPSSWAPIARRPLAPDPDAPAPARPALAGPPTTDLGPPVAAPDLDDYDDEDDEDDDLDDDLRGPAVERTEVLWRAPGLDDDEPEPAPQAAVVTRPPEVTPSENPYTGVRPRRFAAAPTDPEPVDPDEAAADGPEGRRVRVVLSERRMTARSVRPVVDVQDPGTVGTTLRNGLVSNQLFLAARVFGVALLGLGLLPALFAAFPSIGEVSMIGLRVPWLLLGFLGYPFLFGLGWWYVNSAERVEQDFAEGVQER